MTYTLRLRHKVSPYAKASAPPEFYDERHGVIGDSRAEQYVPLYEAAAALVPFGAVVELGCGAGSFYPYVVRRTESYIGLDFAPALVAAARDRWQARFRVADLRTDPIPAADCYVALEVIEHLDNDLALIRRLPSGASIVLSVPSFDSASHVRFFPERGQALKRYARLITGLSTAYVDLPNGGGFFHLLAGTIR